MIWVSQLIRPFELPQVYSSHRCLYMGERSLSQCNTKDQQFLMNACFFFGTATHNIFFAGLQVVCSLCLHVIWEHFWLLSLWKFVDIATSLIQMYPNVAKYLLRTLWQFSRPLVLLGAHFMSVFSFFFLLYLVFKFIMGRDSKSLIKQCELELPFPLNRIQETFIVFHILTSLQWHSHKHRLWL